MVDSSGYRMPAEFEKQSAVWLGWPVFQWYSEPLMDTRHPIAEIIKALSDYKISAQILCKNADGESAARSWLTKAGFSITPYMKFVHIDQVDIWMRDYGPIFLLNENNEYGMAGFQQNQWGYSTTADPVSVAMTAVPGHVAEFLGIKNIFSTTAVSEGGDRMVNGKGVLFVNRAVEFQRNPESSQTELEYAFASMLGVKKIIWFNHGVREDLHADWGPIPYTDEAGKTIFLYGPQTTGGHLDEFIRFASPNKVVLAKVSEDEAARDSISAVNYARLEEAYRIVSSSTDQDGNPFEIVRLPVPDTAYQKINPDQPMYQYLAKLEYPPEVPKFPDNEPIYVVESSSYANYLVTNGLVVAPKYGNAEKDDQVAGILSDAYPGRHVVQIDPSAINYGGGGIHCCTQQQPGV